MSSIVVPKCPDCGASMTLRSSRYGPFYGCNDFPYCRGTVSAHADGRPKALPADAATRLARTQAHEAFDALWQREHMRRGDAYRWLAQRLGIGSDECHIALFDRAMCLKVIALCKPIGAFITRRA